MVAAAVRDVHKRFGETVALEGVDLTVEDGEIFGLIGPNGAGKTTLIRCLTGAITPEEGSVELLSQDPASVVRARIGLLPQAFDPAPRLTPLELVSYYAGLYDQSRDPAEVLSDVGVDATRGTWYRDLSGGEQRRVCVATALVNNPDILLLDEPTTGIDPAGRRSIWQMLRELRGGGTTILVTTHDMGEAETLADTVGLLADGRLVASGPPTDLIREYGGGARLVVETDSPPPDTFALDRTHSTEDGFYIEGVTSGDIGTIVRELDDSGLAFEGLRWREPDLEDVYLTLTDTDRGEWRTGQ